MTTDFKVGGDALACPAIPPRGPLLGRTGRVLALLFPDVPQPRPQSCARAVVAALGYLLAVALGAWVLLERQVGARPWNTIWAEDGGIFYPGALLHPLTSVMQPYAGYLQLVPRLIAEGVAVLPLRAAAAGFAIAGALVAAACAVFVCHASAGHVRTQALRWLLAAGVIFLPSALTEISDNGVNTPWYLLFALFWALLWRPRSGKAMAVSAVVCFAAASSNALAAVCAPLVLARLIALPRGREQVASLGWAAGGALQLVAVVRSARFHQVGHISVGLHFYLRSVLVTAVAGRHFAALLNAATGAALGAAIPACVMAAVAVWALITGEPQIRMFVTTALGLGIALVLVSAIARGWGAPGLDHAAQPGDRYATTPIWLAYSLAVVVIDGYLQHASDCGRRARGSLAAAALAALMGAVWAADFSYISMRSTDPPWSQIVSGFQQRCEQQPSPTAWAQLPPMHWIRMPPTLPCSLLNLGARPAQPQYLATGQIIGRTAFGDAAMDAGGGHHRHHRRDQGDPLLGQDQIATMMTTNGLPLLDRFDA
ncbi:MAG TPA: hypothetical protein VGS19_04595 [Streptosporangiaceae bacterium]|nr:hypothetical protein [Streptosporangiaceae bacterium]